MHDTKTKRKEKASNKSLAGTELTWTKIAEMTKFGGKITWMQDGQFLN